MTTKIILFILTITIYLGCSGVKIPKSLGDPKNNFSYGYHPLDPLPVITIDTLESKDKNFRLQKSLPDESMRIAIGNYSRNGGITYGNNSIGYKGNRYIVILDYIKYDTKAFNVGVLKAYNRLDEKRNDEIYILPVDSLESSGKKFMEEIRHFEGRYSRNGYTRSSVSTTTQFTTSEATLPVFIGIGLRLTATIEVNKGSVDLGNLTALGVAAESGNVSGTLVIQTLGISGENISNLIMMPSEINTTTIQNAILSLGAIKAKMYENDVVLTPRVVGLYNNVGGGEKAINGFITSFLQVPIVHEIKDIK